MANLTVIENLDLAVRKFYISLKCMSDDRDGKREVVGAFMKMELYKMKNEKNEHEYENFYKEVLSALGKKLK